MKTHNSRQFTDNDLNLLSSHRYVAQERRRRVGEWQGYWNLSDAIRRYNRVACMALGDRVIDRAYGESAIEVDRDFDRNACPGCGGGCQVACA